MKGSDLLTECIACVKSALDTYEHANDLDLKDYEYDQIIPIMQDLADAENDLYSLRDQVVTREEDA